MSRASSVLLRLTRTELGVLRCDVDDWFGPLDDDLLALAERAANAIERDLLDGNDRPPGAQPPRPMI